MRPMDSARSDFEREYGTRYEIIESLGAGDSGRTFRAYDRTRRIQVCVKLFHGGSAPRGATRDWHITSTLKHPAVNDTFTVEQFESGGVVAHAVVSRFVAGWVFDNAVRRLDATPSEYLTALRMRLLHLPFHDICQGIAACHRLGFGHGDLHGRNIILRQQGADLGAVVIDFDNATLGEPDVASEHEKKAKDIRSLRRLVGFVTDGWRWHHTMQALLDHHEDISGFQSALTWARGFLGTASGFGGNEINLQAFCDALYRADFVQEDSADHADAMLNALREVATDLAMEPALRQAEQEWHQRTRNRATFRLSAIPPSLDAIYSDLLGPK